MLPSCVKMPPPGTPDTTEVTVITSCVRLLRLMASTLSSSTSSWLMCMVKEDAVSLRASSVRGDSTETVSVPSTMWM